MRCSKSVAAWAALAVPYISAASIADLPTCAVGTLRDGWQCTAILILAVESSIFRSSGHGLHHDRLPLPLQFVELHQRPAVPSHDTMQPS